VVFRFDLNGCFKTSLPSFDSQALFASEGARFRYRLGYAQREGISERKL
jgi:hypothetical protein